MHHLTQELKNLFSFAKASKLIVGGVAVLAVSAFAGWSIFLSQPHAAEAAVEQDCDTNAIIECGFLAGSRDSAVTGFLNDYETDKTKDLEYVFHEYGLSKSELPRFKKDAKLGHVTKDGKVVVDSKVVGENARSLGRQNLSGSQKKTISVKGDNKTFYERSTKVSFKTEQIPALILMNGDKVEFVVLSSCGNPVTSTPPKEETPPAKDIVCADLTYKKIGKPEENIYELKAKANKTDGEFYGYYYALYRIVNDKEQFIADTDVKGDKSYTTSNLTKGSYVAKARVWTQKGDAYHRTDISDACTLKFTVPEKPTTPPTTPPATKPGIGECIKLNATLRAGTRGIYDYEVETKLENNAKVINYTFDFGQEGTPVRTITSNKTDFEYTKEGDHTTKVTVLFEIDGKQVSKSGSACEAKTPFAPAPQPPTTPIVPAVSTTPTPPAPAAKTPETPAALPATGLETALSGLFGTSALGGAAYYWRSSRRELFGRLLGR